MFQLLLDGSLSPNWTRARIAHRLALSAARRRDAIVRYRLNGRTLALPLSHDLPWNRRVHPGYSENLRRLATFLRRDGAPLSMVDVGANIGDSWALADSQPGDRFLLIEGSPRWFALLERNTAADPAVTRVQALLSDRAGEAPGAIVAEGGNARVAESRSQVRFETLDGVIAAHPAFREARLVKVDVEGYDPRVLRGARGLLSAAAPVLFFEHYPKLLDLAGEPECGVFGELAVLGYRTFLFYDHRGRWVGEVSATDGPRLAALMREARERDGFYYDVCAFPDRDAAACDAFAAAERARPAES